MAYLKVSKFREAERDASKSLQLLPAGNPKAFYRRGLARKALGKIDLARQDFEAVLKEEPSNASVKAELEGLAKSQPSSESPVKKAPSSAETKAASNTPVPASTAASTVSASSNGNQADRQKALKAAITPESSKSAGDGIMSAVSTRRLTPVPKEAAGENTKSTISSAESSSTGPKDFKSLRAARDQRFKATSPIPVSPKPALNDTSKQEASTSAVSFSTDTPTTQNTLQDTTVPRNMYEFEKRWNDNRDTASRASMIIALVKQKIPLPAFFGSSLTPELLGEILECLKLACRDFPDCRSMSVAFLAALPQCPRFDFVSMLCANTSLVKGIVDGDPRAPEILAAWGAV
ncbi:hypothetical protein P389DRAFT_65020 [Cystobasidium minutum MCA 4210]|uniref:uncharacterized protein n=1 Tax=Cystobasidium minutum MCA 4210 TaxID=1397322 RepID=UPI0034CD0CF8|eukprot:jgi/Rhomi1/65020/CE65019_564